MSRGRTFARVAVAVAVALAVALVAFAASLDDDGKEPRHESRTSEVVATEWTERAAVAYAPLGDAALRLPAYVREWLDGNRPTEQLRGDLGKALAEVTEVRERLSGLPPFPFNPAVVPLYRSSSALYVEHVRIYEEALAVPPGDVRTQLDLLARRTRLLADRVFDRGQALVKPHLAEEQNPDVVINLPEDVPNWAAEGLAAGPPLAAPPPTRSASPPLREESRPVQPPASWLAAVRDAGAPPVEELDRAITTRDAAELGTLAQQLEAAAEKLRVVPDPDGDGGREESARTRLGLLVQSEAMRIAQAAAVFGLPALVDVADRVLAAGEPVR